MPRTARPAAAVAALVAGLALAGCGGGSRGEAPRGLVAADERRPAPELAGTTLTGEAFDVAALRGSPVVVNIWGSWCAPCKKEQPDLVRAAADTAAAGVRFVGIDVRDRRDNALAHNRRYGVTYPSLFDEGLRLVARFEDVPPSAIPSTILLDRRGRVAAVLVGPTTYDEVTGLARRLAEEPE